MGTVIRPEISAKHPYWIDKHRYYELKHFCLQYPTWRRMYNSLICSPSSWPTFTPISNTNVISNPIVKNIDERLYYANRMELIERVAKATDETLANYILKGVTEGISYDHLKVSMQIPCCKDTYYELYRRFFWILSKER